MSTKQSDILKGMENFIELLIKYKNKILTLIECVW